MAITEDASAPIVKTLAGTANPTTASFSPPANSLLVAIVGGGWGSTQPTTATVTDSGGHTWTAAVTKAGTTASGGVVVIAYTYLSSAPGSITVTATFTRLSGGSQVAVKVLNGCNPSQSGAGTGTAEQVTNSTTGTVSITTTQTGSQVYGMNDVRNSATVNFTANGATTIISNFVDTGTDSIELCSWKATSLTGTPGATTLGGSYDAVCGTATAALEILPAAAVAYDSFMVNKALRRSTIY
jgi:hypothetical protein